jgi:hypothetical protein
MPNYTVHIPTHCDICSQPLGDHVTPWGFDAAAHVQCANAYNAGKNAERERIYSIVLRAPYAHPHEDDEDGWGKTEMELKAMAFDITSQILGHVKPQQPSQVVIDFKAPTT